MATPPFLYDYAMISDYDVDDISYDGDNMESVAGAEGLGNGTWAWVQTLTGGTTPLSTFVAASIVSDANFFTTSSVTIPTPTGTAAGDSLVAFAAADTAAAPTGIAGFTLLGSVSASGAGPTMSAYHRVAQDPVPADYTFSWAGNEVGIMGQIATYTAGQVASPHHEGSSSFSNTNPPGDFTVTQAEHVATVNSQVIYGYYAKSVGALTGGALTMPTQATERLNAPWIPADVGTRRAWMGLSDERVNAASEPARSAQFTWPTAGATTSGILIRVVSVA